MCRKWGKGLGRRRLTLAGGVGGGCANFAASTAAFGCLIQINRGNLYALSQIRRSS
jgi:hypothetical protein